MRGLLLFAAVVEIGTGLALMIDPAIVGLLLLGAETAGTGTVREDVTLQIHLCLLAPGQVFNRNYLIRSYQNIGNLNFFETPMAAPETRPSGDDPAFDADEYESGNHAVAQLLAYRSAPLAPPTGPSGSSNRRIKSFVSVTRLLALLCGMLAAQGQLLLRELAAPEVFFDGDPLTDITAVTRVAFVMKGGKVIKNVAGYVPDVAPYFCGTRISISPLRRIR